MKRSHPDRTITKRENKIKPKKRKTPKRSLLIEDPIRYAETISSGTWKKEKTVFPWGPAASFSTTGQFANMGKGMKRHCGPTAVTNLMRTLMETEKRTKETEKESVTINRDEANENRRLFRQIADIGRRSGIYWNMDLFGRFGGTLDFYTGIYIRKAFRRFFPGKKIHTRLKFCLNPGSLPERIVKKHLLYLILHFNPVYGAHHVLCYGYTRLRSDKGERMLFLLIADGWSDRPRYLPAEEMKGRMYIDIY